LCKSRIHMVILFRHNLLFVSLHVPPEVGRPRAVVDNVMSSYPLDLLSCIISNTPPPISALSPSVTVTVTSDVKGPESGGCVTANGTMYWLWTKVRISAGMGENSPIFVLTSYKFDPICIDVVCNGGNQCSRRCII